MNLCRDCAHCIRDMTYKDPEAQTEFGICGFSRGPGFTNLASGRAQYNDGKLCILVRLSGHKNAEDCPNFKPNAAETIAQIGLTGLICIAIAFTVACALGVWLFLIT